MEDINLIYILFILMLVITLIGIYIFNFDFLEPANLFNIAMTTSMLFSVLNVDRWDLFVGSYTCILVLIGMMSFLIGDIFCGYNCFKFYKQIKPLDKDIFLNISKVKFLILNFFITVLLYFSFMEVYDLSLQIGNTEGILGMIKTVRYPFERGEINFSRWQSYRNYFSESFVYISGYCLFSNILVNNKFEIKYIYPIIICLLFVILSTGRYNLLFLITYIASLFSILFLKKYEYCKKYKFNILFIGVITIFLFLLLFLLLGSLTGKTITQERTPFIILSHYLGLSIPALDKFLVNTVLLENSYIGINSLPSIYGNLRTLGMELPVIKLFAPFVEFNGVNTNVYTALMRYYSDFGFVSGSVLLFLFGNMFSFIYNYIKYKTNNAILVILYSSCVGYIVLSFHDENFLRWMLTTGTIYKIVLIYVIYKFIKLDSCKFTKSNS